jgi:hypothetical protein
MLSCLMIHVYIIVLPLCLIDDWGVWSSSCHWREGIRNTESVGGMSTAMPRMSALMMSRVERSQNN